MIIVKTDKEKYVGGERIEISGQVAPVRAGQLVLLRITNPRGALARTDPIEVMPDGRYAYSFRSAGPLMETDGNYTILVSYAGETSSKSIYHSAKTLGDKIVIIASGTISSFGSRPASLEPSQLSLIPGNTITFLNQDSNLHNLVSGDAKTVTPDGKFDTGMIPAGKSSTITVRQSGQLTYFCNLHPNETGVFVVSPADESKHVVIQESVKISDSVSVKVIRGTTEDDGFNRLIAANRRAAKLERHFGPDVIGNIDFDILAKRKTRKLTLVFWDISNYTSLCEILKANLEHVSLFLIEYYEEATRVIFEQNGSLDKFMGDGAMAIFGVDSQDESGQVDARSAVSAALEFRPRFERLTKKWLPIWERLVPEHIEIGLKCGIHTGDVNYGNFGTSTNDQFTAIGAAANIANRLADEANAGQIIISKTTKSIIGDGYSITRLGMAKLKNISGEVEIFNVNNHSQQSH